jgi:hypothetical protein
MHGLNGLGEHFGLVETGIELGELITHESLLQGDPLGLVLGVRVLQYS